MVTCREYDECVGVHIFGPDASEESQTQSKIGRKSMDFILTMMDFILRMMDFILTMMDFILTI